ncbi:hypothetical protein F3Y22_tig00116954pilonHSYRG00164 [Hibiscus syriacus]|uniref:CCHC-type domain-containing protein n=1 Tax=Hibiscus syriacus TaxID=106335 RepID=A0A6A2WYU9_HIBSY|nr:hypothetical protein F3Y22_tig00116954pilonHSYRG00164 [Hibiscus syriacus]
MNSDKLPRVTLADYDTTKKVRLKPPDDADVQDLEMAIVDPISEEPEGPVVTETSVPSLLHPEAGLQLQEMSIDSPSTQNHSYASILDSEANAATKDLNDFVIEDDDIIIGTRFSLPSIQFSECEYKKMEASMANTLILKLLGRNIGLSSKMRKTTLRFWPMDPGLSMANTSPFNLRRWIFEHLILTEHKIQIVEYENLPLICFSCGRFGHKNEACSFTNPTIASSVYLRRFIIPRMIIWWRGAAGVILQILPILRLTLNTDEATKWKPPPLEVLKLNTDEAMQPSSMEAASGGVFRDEKVSGSLDIAGESTNALPSKPNYGLLHPPQSFEPTLLRRIHDVLNRS